MSDPHQPSSTEYFRRGEPVTGGRNTGEHSAFELRMAAFEKQLAELGRVAERLERLAAIDSDVRAKAPSDKATRGDPKKPQMSAALTRANLHVRIGYGVLTVGALGLTVGGVNVFSYAKGLSKGDEERVQTMAEAKAVREQLDDHETRITDAVKTQGTTAATTATELRYLGELQLLQWQYMAEVVEAIRRKREIPKKSEVLQDAEARALVSLRDAK